MNQLFESIVKLMEATIEQRFYTEVGSRATCLVYRGKEEYELTVTESNVFLRQLPQHFGLRFNSADPGLMDQIVRALTYDHLLDVDWAVHCSDVFGRDSLQRAFKS